MMRRAILFFPAILFLSACSSHQREEQEDLERQIESHRRDIQSCYDDQVAQNNLIDEGTIRLKITQLKNGKVTHVEEVGGFPGSEPVSQCISKKIRSWELGKPSDDTEFNVRWSFVKRPCIATNTCPPEDKAAYPDEVLDSVMRTREQEIQNCSKTFSASTSDQSRRVEVSFFVDQEGHIERLENITGSEESAAAFACISPSVQSLSFPPRPDGPKYVKITWSWVFPVGQWEVVR